MIKALIFDGDGVVILRTNRFSDRLAADFGIMPEATAPFFRGIFRQCQIGKADLMKEIQPYYREWGWKGELDELIDYWFSKEGTRNEEILSMIRGLRKASIPVFLATDNEKYRTDYIVNEFGLGKEFDGIFSSAYVGFRKEEAGFWKHLTAAAAWKPDEMLVWDDEIENIACAKAAGFTAEQFTGMDDFRMKMRSYFPENM